jgi:hypothetical protein
MMEMIGTDSLSEWVKIMWQASACGSRQFCMNYDPRTLLKEETDSATFNVQA